MVKIVGDDFFFDFVSLGILTNIFEHDIMVLMKTTIKLTKKISRLLWTQAWKRAAKKWYNNYGEFFLNEYLPLLGICERQEKLIKDLRKEINALQKDRGYSTLDLR